jgi:hypothetical protein
MFFRGSPPGFCAQLSQGILPPDRRPRLTMLAVAVSYI